MIGKITGSKVVGIKQTTKALKNNEGKLLYVAKDADSRLVEPIIALAKAKSIEIVFVDTMKELGVLCSIDVSAAIALVL